MAFGSAVVGAARKHRPVVVLWPKPHIKELPKGYRHCGAPCTHTWHRADYPTVARDFTREVIPVLYERDRRSTRSSYIPPFPVDDRQLHSTALDDSSIPLFSTPKYTLHPAHFEHMEYLGRAAKPTFIPDFSTSIDDWASILAKHSPQLLCDTLSVRWSLPRLSSMYRALRKFDHAPVKTYDEASAAFADRSLRQTFGFTQARAEMEYLRAIGLAAQPLPGYKWHTNTGLPYNMTHRDKLSACDEACAEAAPFFQPGVTSVPKYDWEVFGKHKEHAANKPLA